jgi:hypothetical protein
VKRYSYCIFHLYPAYYGLRKLNRATQIVCVLAGLCICTPAQQIVPLTGGYAGSTLNQHLHADKLTSRDAQEAIKKPKVVVFTGDRVIAQFVDGASWLTAITVVNLENHPTSFDVLFFRDDGSDLIVPVVGQGPVRGMQIALTTAGSLTFQTTGTANGLAQGWALLSQSNSDSIGMFAIFRQSVPGRQPQEAVVPTVNQFENHFVLPYDNTQFVTGIALANPTTNAVVIPANIRNELGQIIDTRQLSLGPYGHTAFTLPDRWPSTSGQRGIIEFLTTGFGVGALGLRFNGAAFTSLSVLENFAWTQ